MKKALSLVEVIISIFVIAVMGVFVVGAINNFFMWVFQIKNIKEFSSNYNNMLNYMYSNGYAGWDLYEANGTGLVMYNTGYITNMTGFIGYDCWENGVGTTSLVTDAADINWDEFDTVFTGINCEYLTWWNVDGGYWLNFNISVLKNPMDLRYFVERE